MLSFFPSGPALQSLRPLLPTPWCTTLCFAFNRKKTLVHVLPGQKAGMHLSLNLLSRVGGGGKSLSVKGRKQGLLF